MPKNQPVHCFLAYWNKMWFSHQLLFSGEKDVSLVVMCKGKPTFSLLNQGRNELNVMWLEGKISLLARLECYLFPTSFHILPPFHMTTPILLLLRNVVDIGKSSLNPIFFNPRKTEKRQANQSSKFRLFCALGTLLWKLQQKNITYWVKSDLFVIET